MRFHNSKKADAYRMLNWGTWRLIFLSILFFIIYHIVSSNINAKIDIFDLKSSIVSQRILSSPTGIAASSSRSGVVDMAKFSDSTLAKQFDDSSDRLSISLTLYDSNEKMSEAYLNKQWFERYYPLKKFKQYHSGLYWRPVLVKNQTITNGKINIRTLYHE